MSFVERFDAEGWLSVGGIFDPAFIDDLRCELDRQFDGLVATASERCCCLEVGPGRFMLSVKLEGPFQRPELYANRMLLGIVRALLGPDLLIDSVTCVVAMPGAGDQEVHRDVPVLFQESPGTSCQVPSYALTAVIPLIDLAPETGTTRLLPRTHRGLESEDDETPFLRRGDCFLMDARLRHHGLANRSADRRPILYIVYSRPWFTDMENFTRQPRINMDPGDIPGIAQEHRPLFRRLAGHGTADITEKQLLSSRGNR